jgi:hypothetical protein
MTPTPDVNKLDVRAPARSPLMRSRGDRGAWCTGIKASPRRCARDLNVARGDVRFEADCRLKADIAPSPKCAMNGLMHRSKLQSYRDPLSRFNLL